MCTYILSSVSMMPRQSIWLSVDPLSDKYPSLSPYNYCANNPIKYVDPDGREVEHNSFKDKIYTAIAWVLSSEFRNNYKELSASEETYVFKSNKSNNSSFTTDGDKLYVNFSSKKASKSQGDNWYTDLKHETEHAMQFEYGEFGFYGIICSILGDEYKTSKWRSINFDLHDEVKARDKGYSSTFVLNSDPNKSSKNSWKFDNPTFDEKKQILRDAGYKGEVPVNNSNPEKLKDNLYYMLHNRQRN